MKTARRNGGGGNVEDWTSSEDIEGTSDRRRVLRVCRGGCWIYTARDCRAAIRYRDEPARVASGLGFRLARSR